eukprot:6940848-Heterocapsa_arctica.AAC.1
MPNGCTKSAADCTHKHVKVSPEEAKKLTKPPTTAERSGSPAKPPKDPKKPPADPDKGKKENALVS